MWVLKPCAHHKKCKSTLRKNLSHLANWQARHGSVFVCVCLWGESGIDPASRWAPLHCSAQSSTHTGSSRRMDVGVCVCHWPSDTSHNWSSLPLCFPRECNKWSAIRPMELIIEMVCKYRFPYDNQGCWRLAKVGKFFFLLTDYLTVSTALRCVHSLKITNN